MYQVYRFTIRDFRQDDFELKFRGPIQSGNAQAEAVMLDIEAKLNAVVNGQVWLRSYGIEEALPPNPRPMDSTNLLVIKAGYTTDNGVEDYIEIPSPEVDIIDFLQGDLIKLNKQPIKALLDLIEDDLLDYSSGVGLNFDYAVLVGKE